MATRYAITSRHTKYPRIKSDKVHHRHRTMVYNMIASMYPEDESISSAEYSVVPTKKHERKRPRAVSFNPDVIAQEILHVNNYSHTEWTNTWYTREDFRSMKKECQITVNLIERGILHGDCEKYCITGLERRIRSHNNSARKARKEKGIDAVLREQAQQEHTGVTDAEAISASYVDAIRRPDTAAPKCVPRAAVAPNMSRRQRKISMTLPRVIAQTKRVCIFSLSLRSC